ncbi:ABC transporter substrate-binding protein [Agromyces aurantiacus]|uniref:ABC transporter substrate-binding protein n=1 Tax=Agromyces aurantiacus TaxID=165814 RepID=A0ABV9R7P5_9MICO|nr:extracellular solute-binding protein [Agromyces aurantiacus]MBM7503962.1 multiple sugar transport system substrate-binding protein [Agromyces aurantiacus]
MNTKHLLAATATLVLAGSLAACTPGGDNGNDDANCTNKIPKADLPVVTMWAWYPNMELVVDNFNEQNDEVQVCWTNAGAGGDEYDKFQTAVSAGSGAPDVVMLEADRIPTFQAQNALVELNDLGYQDVKENFSDGAWKDVSVGDGVYGAPVDGGPMGMIYRKDIFDQYGIMPPTTWDEYEAAAQKVKDAGGPFFGDLGANVPAVMMALQYQNGAQPFTYDAASPENIGIKLNDDASKEVLDYWAGLSSKGLVGKQDQFTPEYISGVIGGEYATYLSAAWAPGYLQGAGVGEGADEGVWATAPLPQWDPANPVSVNWGGSAFSVTEQADDPGLAAKVAFGVYADDASLEDGWKNQIIFPLNVNVLEDPAFQDYEVPFFGGQQANKEVYVPAAKAYTGMTYTPIGQYYYSAFTEQLAAINDGSTSGSEAADALQKDVEGYAKEQGYTVE